MSFRGAGKWITLVLERARLAHSPFLVFEQISSSRKANRFWNMFNYLNFTIFATQPNNISAVNYYLPSRQYSLFMCCLIAKTTWIIVFTSVSFQLVLHNQPDDQDQDQSRNATDDQEQHALVCRRNVTKAETRMHRLDTCVKSHIVLRFTICLKFSSSYSKRIQCYLTVWSLLTLYIDIVWQRLASATQAVHKADVLACVMWQHFFAKQLALISFFLNFIRVLLPPKRHIPIGTVMETSQSDFIALI